MSRGGAPKSSKLVLIEPAFTVESRVLPKGNHTIPPQPDFLILFLKASTIRGLPAGACLFGNPNLPLDPGVCGGRCEALAVRLSAELLIEKAAGLRLYRTGAQLLFSRAQAVGDERLSGLLSLIDNELGSRAAGWREMIGSLVQQLSVHLLRHHINVRRSDEIELSRAGIVDRRLRRAIEFMHDNCARDLSLAEIAGQAYLSAFHFARLFKKITGTTPHAYLAMLRIERSRRLLAETDLPITEVGALVGYPGQSHFTKVFRETTGMTPLAFRRAAEGEG